MAFNVPSHSLKSPVQEEDFGRKGVGFRRITLKLGVAFQQASKLRHTLANAQYL